MTESLYLKGEEKFGPVTSRLYSGFSGMSSKRLYGQILEMVKKSGPARLLDVGCGPSDILLKLSQHTENLELYGVDPSPHMVKISRDRIAKHGHNRRIHVDLGSSRSVPFQGTFDMIITSFSFHHWKEQIKSLEYLAGRLSITGVLVILELNSDAYPGKIPMVKKHSLSGKAAEELNIPGYEQRVEYSPDRKIIQLLYSRPDSK